MIPPADTAFDPDAVLQWLSKCAETLQADRVLRSWLEAGLGTEPVRDYVIAWLHRYAHLHEAAFLLTAWLKAGGDRQPVRPVVVRWLQIHGEIKQASFVLSAWLRSGGSTKAVQGVVRRWLALYATQDEAVFVLTAWLSGRGALPAIKEPILIWLRAHPGRTESLPLIRRLASRQDLPYELLAFILQWCRGVPQHALRILVRLEANLLHPGFKTEVLSVFELAARPVLYQPKLAVIQRTSLATLFEVLGESPFLRARTGEAFLLWLHHPHAFREVTSREHILRHRTDRPATLRYVADLVRSRKIDPERDRAALLRCFRWINTWIASQPQKGRELLAELLQAGTAPAAEPAPAFSKEIDGRREIGPPRQLTEQE